MMQADEQLSSVAFVNGKVNTPVYLPVRIYTSNALERSLLGQRAAGFWKCAVRVRKRAVWHG